MDNEREQIRTMVRGTYDLQKLRIQMGNRVVANFKAKLGQEPGEKEEELKAHAKIVLNALRSSYKRITDGVVKFPKRGTWSGDEIISTQTELCLAAEYFDIEGAETEHFARLGTILKGVPIYSQYLESVRGVGPAMAGVIISEIDIEKAQYPSSLWRYAGLDVEIESGEGRSRRKHHLVEVEYTAADGTVKTRNSITFNPFLKTKLMGVLATSFLRCGDNPYRTIYLDYKQRLESRPDWQDRSKGHRHNAAMRYMVKMFLIDLYTRWRAMEDLPVAEPYHVAKLGIKHRVA